MHRAKLCFLRVNNTSSVIITSSEIWVKFAHSGARAGSFNCSHFDLCQLSRKHASVQLYDLMAGTPAITVVLLPDDMERIQWQQTYTSSAAPRYVSKVHSVSGNRKCTATAQHTAALMNSLPPSFLHSDILRAAQGTCVQLGSTGQFTPG